MNDRKLKKLFELTRSETPPVPSEAFDARVLRAVRREARVSPVSFWDQLEALLPRIAMGTALVVGLCVLGDFCFTALYPANLSTEVTEISDQWLFAANVN